ncbi:GDP-L-fucose synthase [uncultured Pseudodesulfovibrio sp.]|uniref:GDP-L-fucose synthase n=1 Tax=uncultured Pseudodesulfovibrio sp. TaxID=2035858 RepID=UPI0029C92286|nr:GDP-L-fucose synthase [uncultured Pseudodesulfovibrio sp.]
MILSPSDKIYVAGHRGLVGSAILRKLEKEGCENFVLRTSSELDLREQKDVRAFFEQEKPHYVFLAAAHVGGIHANSTYPADFIRDNLLIQTNIIDAAYKAGSKKLLFLGSSCIYPKFAPQPMPEDALLTSELEATNEWYAIAKIAGLKMCAAYRRQYGFNAISAMPTNLYGPKDNFDLETSHVIPALIRKVHEAKVSGASEVTVWGTGTPTREFLHVDDLADACIHLIRNYEEEQWINVGTGKEIPIGDLARLIIDVVGFSGDMVFDTTKPDGTPRKVLDVTKINKLGWESTTPLRKGLEETYQWFCKNHESHGRRF